MTEISYDQLISEAISARVDSDDSIWRIAAIFYFIKYQLGASGKMIASDTNYSESYVSKLIKTFTAFPEEDERAKDKSFSLHMICADTDNPADWLDKAIENGWSVRQLNGAIREGKPNKTEVEVAGIVWDKIMSILDGRGEGAEWLKQRIIELQMSAL
jgi:hypothetical protein